MNIEPLSDDKIIESWQHNAQPWISAVRGGEIESRRLVTDTAVLDAVLACRPATVIDLGCGEGWLALALLARGIEVTGIDAIATLVEAARQAGVSDCRLMSYEQIAAGELALQADTVVCNFSLLGKQAVDDLLRAVPTMLKPGGKLVVQTLHPLAACGDLPYVDGWRPGSWAGFSDAFSDAPPWYFRTLHTWIELLQASGLTLDALHEPLNPNTARPASVIFIAHVRASPTPDELDVSHPAANLHVPNKDPIRRARRIPPDTPA
ncbi:class I SAM-dependent methyltransferase [Paraburkholderia sp.]|jgi:2-polyprenyl-3-methyl-5-hydroxy-6-metoxy-1,4-benzoquinol methylase|uniref:class I SAM-dependent methyltransferase n=1 Tax=Paraburkholderia sp. TaxID=1926495 RepID=UPI002F3E5CEB